ncbi:uncharacterized protein LOC124940662 [Impatiens glandulifera]|uniref:uncharacterized protein LOC124940662 n=1 Tax=Impatiens glandulifera TaxID=253017 RepID=UPI001FB14D7C|nr:uncharacterized protein LOC124940662 [Impatiens glandulifera]
MFEAHVLHLLRRYLGEYVHGLSTEALRISVWKGDVVLKDLKLKAEALNSLKLPVTVKAGFVGTITLKVPWKSLGKEPVVVLIDRVFVLAHPAVDGRSLKAEDREKLFEAKLQQIQEAESATLEALSRSKLGNPSSGNSWLGSLIATIIGNLKISISNVHVRYEDSISNPGHPFACGITLAKLAAVTMDEQGNETFDTSGALDRLRKSLQLERLAAYHDSNSIPWVLNKKWEDLNPREWIEIFEDGVNEPTKQNDVSKWSHNRSYVISPVNGDLKYHRLGNKERNNLEIPFEKVSLVVSDLTLAITEAQYHDWIRLLEVVSRYKTYVEISHLRPIVSVAEGRNLWWKYAAQATLQLKKVCYRMSWDRIKYLCQLRRRYIKLYASSLQQLPNHGSLEMRAIEKDLDLKVILLWRFLAHAKVESVKSKEAAEQQMLKRSWFSFRRNAPTDASVVNPVDESSSSIQDRLTNEQWQAINKLLSYQPDEELSLPSGKDMQNVTRFLVDVSLGQAAARIININQTEVLCGRFEELHVTTKFKPRGTHCDMKLRFYGLSAPEGSIAQSVSSEQKVNALSATFVRSPVGENVDWRLSAMISPCHVTVLMDSYDRFLEFVKRSNAISPTIALETAAVLQNKIEKVTRRAQEQFQLVLEEQSRFALDIDLDAPKVRVPIRSVGSSKCASHFLLDFGHFTLHTKEGQPGEHAHSLYSRFYISGRDIAAFFTECGSDAQSCALVSPILSGHSSEPPISETAESLCSLIDRCGIAVIVDQIKMLHPSYPSTRISVQVPSLGIHFSPARYRQLMELLNIFSGTSQSNSLRDSDNQETELALWNPPDLATEARILVWRGIGFSVAAWQSCFLVLSGLHLYVLESETSQSYQRCSSMAGKQVYEVPPSSVGGSLTCIAVCIRGMDTHKALESFSTLVIEFQNQEEKASWLRGLMQATYQASVPSSVDILGDSADVNAEYNDPHANALKIADLIINGALVESKVSFYGRTGDEAQESLEETKILEILGSGGKVHVICCKSDFNVKMKLHSFKILDELQGSRTSGPHYLACSALRSDSHNLDDQEKDFPSVVLEEDDTFADALSDFVSLPDSGSYFEMVYSSVPADIENTETDQDARLAYDMNAITRKSISDDTFFEAQGSDDSDFICVTFSTRNPNSPDYDGMDTKMNIRMSKLEFFCNRPTLVALIGFGFDISSGNKGASDVSMVSLEEEPLEKKDKMEGTGNTFVKGLLGYGKGRVVFNLNMDVDSVIMFLNKEDGSQLAMFVQESFVLDLKVHPSSISIGGTLGNFRLCDMSLGPDHCWGWLCDIRNQGADSLIKFTFNSYSAEDDDYEGYDYSLYGRLSAVRIVFLYRFVQEITSYFMELATPHTEEAIKLVDKVGGLEWFINKYEIDGAKAIKLDLSLDTPIIIVPKNSNSKDFMQLDLGQLKLRNQFSWHGCPDNPKAVHLDVLDAEILGINMAVGIDGCVGKPMIREGRGIHIFVRRSLRDLFRTVPNFALDVKVGLIHVVMSDKEYHVIRECLVLNLSEQPKLPPSFRDSMSSSKDTIRMLADKVNANGQMLLSRTVTIIAVEVEQALLELCNGNHEDSPLAHVALDGLWVSYRMTSLSEADLYVTVPSFCVLDVRPDTKPEMRLMLGSCTDLPKYATGGRFPFHVNRGSFIRIDYQATPSLDIPTSTMLLMDCHWRLASQSFVIRLQQPRVLVVPDFLLAVGEFFLPSLGTITGREELMDPKNDPITKNNNIVLSAPIFKQVEDIVQLSPDRQLIADAIGIDEYTYDGCGKTICLQEYKEQKELNSLRFRPSIVIGRGKKLRFVNVKIENGSLMRRYTYLSNNSSYSVSPEDHVEISYVLSCNNVQESANHMEESLSGSYTSANDNDLNKKPSLTFEAQVVSPEFTFYDSTMTCLHDTLHGEMLLRAKLDFSFMYASKENDTWVRALAKDLTVEAGSGLVILNPMDVSGGYTSVKDKTNLSLISTDVYIHLPLSVISLLLHLQAQATTALQFGNSDPLAPCTNFDRIWSSSKENELCYNLTFWRPRAPSNYVILGDCVTSRPSPPSQAVMAVSNRYGRVRKPVGFRLMGLFSGSGGAEKGETQSDGDCCLWMPVAPSGYLTLGCVAHTGRNPPPNHIVHCIRADLVTSTSYSECISSIASKPSFESEFSIWRLDNALGSFYSHPSKGSPPRDQSHDLNHLLLCNSSWHSPSKETTSSVASSSNSSSHQPVNQKTTSSGWDILRSISSANYYMSTPNFERIWWDRGSDMRRPFSIWRPISRSGYGILGDCITEGLEPPSLGIIFRADNPEISAKPMQFTKVAQIVRKGVDEAFFWYPVSPSGYASLGCIVTRLDEPPKVDSFCCPRMDLIHQANILEVPISRSSTSKGSQCWSIWKVENQACTFLARSDLKKPSCRLAFTLGDAVKPKARENITAEMKIRCISVTVLDSLGGMMTPLFDGTITNMKLATHGQLDAMNVVLISSMAASTFNKQLEAWEPLIEPFDGIFKFETYDTNPNPPSRVGKRLRIAATSIFNINLSAASLNVFIETILSWRRHRELEKKARKLTEESGSLCGQGDDSTIAALDEDDFQTITIENKLGCDIYLKKVEESLDTTELLHHNDFASVWIPPPRYSDRLNVGDEYKEARRYVSVQILESKGLSVIDDGNSHNFFCALRLIVDAQEANQQKVFPQSARTKCVKPLISKASHLEEGTAKWNELFIFEVPRQGPAKLQVEVTNLAANAGKGEVVGATSISVGHGASTLKKVASVRMISQVPDGQHITSHPLKRKVQDSDNMESSGCLLVSISYFERKQIANLQSDDKTRKDVDRDVGFCVRLDPDGEWETFPSFYPLSVITRKLTYDFIAMEVVMRDGKKHVIFRSLATVVNDSDIKLDILVCPVTMIQSDDVFPATEKILVQEGLDTNTVSSINPNSSAALPWRFLAKDLDYCVQVRPSVDHKQPPNSWGCAAAVGSGYAYGRDQPTIDQGQLSRQNTLKQGNKLPASPLKLSQLEKKDVLLYCSSTGNKQLWLSICTDASILYAELNTPIYDWKITVDSPLKLENRLPCAARFTIWEKMKEGNTVERQHGLILPRKSAHIYSADIRKPIYLSFFVQGGWALEKDPVPVLDLLSNNHASSFWMVQQQRRRRLRVSIERDMGGSTCAPKTIRFFVPYWISNDSSLSLAYRIVEIDRLESADGDSLLISRVKSAKSLRSPSDKKLLGLSKDDAQVLDAIEDTTPTPSMLSPQDYVGRGGVMLFSPRNDTYLSPRLGIAIALRNSESYSHGISLLELEKKQRVDTKAFGSDGSYYKLSATLQMTSDRTKVIHFQPHTLFVNRTGSRLSLRQCDTISIDWIDPMDPPKPLQWQSFSKVETLKLRMDGYDWSTPFNIDLEGMMCVSLKNEITGELMQVRIEVRAGSKSSRYEVIFRPNSMSSPYRVENRSIYLPIHYRQVDGLSDSWRRLPPNAAASFLWEDLGRPKLLELLVDGYDPQKSEKYNIDEIADHQMTCVSNGSSRALWVTILKQEKTNIIRISDMIPENETDPNVSSPLLQLAGNDFPHEQSNTSTCEFHVVVELAELGLSIVDHTPEEILYLSMQNLLLSYSTGLDSGITRFKLRMRGLQVDNQLPLTPMAVLFRPQRVAEETDHIMKFSMTEQSNGSLDLCVYPYIGFQGPENSAFLINVHEPIIWRLHGIFQHVNLSRLSDTQTHAVSMDPIIQIRVLNISEVRFKVSMAMSPSQRPVGVLGFWSSLMTALGNTENMPVRINQRFQEHVCLRQSILVDNAIANIKKDLLSQPLQLLSGVDILGNASSALGHMSKGVAALSMDKKFIQSRQRQENKGVEDIGDVIREGGGAFAKGLFRGVTGILTKPLEGAKASGVEGFVQGVGKGIIGAAAQPVSGVLDLLSKTTEGANAMRMKIASAIASEDQLLRRRLPRVISGDNLLRPYDEYKAQGQAILQLAESGSFFSQVDLFKVRAKFALTDAYEDHFLLPKGKILIVTHRRVLLLQQTSNIIGQRKLNPARDPCLVMWDVLWNDLGTMELTHGKKDRPNTPPTRLIIYLRNRSAETKDQSRVIKCSHEERDQAFEAYCSIDQALNTYGPNQSKVKQRRKVTKPYSPIIETSGLEGKEGFSMWSPQQMPDSVSPSSSI